MCLFSLAYNPADSVSWECLSVDPVWMDHVACAWMSLFPSHIVITLHLSVFFCMVTAVTAPQDLPYQRCSCSCRSVHHWDFKGADHNIFNLPLDPESMTGSHTHCCLFFISLACSFGGSAILYECSEGRATKKKKDERLKVTKSTDQQRTSHRNRGISSTNKSIHTTLKHLYILIGLVYSLCSLFVIQCDSTALPWGVWLHLLIYTKMDRGVDVLCCSYWGHGQGQGLFLLHWEPR